MMDNRAIRRVFEPLKFYRQRLLMTTSIIGWMGLK
jgi:hypothetical protein